MDQIIDIANQAVADYGFRQGVLYSPDDIGRRAGFNPEELAVLEGTVLDLLAALPIPVQPEDIPREQAKMTAAIKAAAGS